MKLMLILIMVATIALSGCAIQSIVEEPPQERGIKIMMDGFTFEKMDMPVRDWKQRTDVFQLNERGCIEMSGKAWVDNTYHEAHFKVYTDIDTCKYNYVKFNSSLKSTTFRQSESPSSQVWFNGYKYSSHSNDNTTKELYLNNLNIYSDGTRMSFVWDEPNHGLDTMCGPLQIEIYAFAGANASCFSSFEICGIEVGNR